MPISRWCSARTPTGCGKSCCSQASASGRTPAPRGSRSAEIGDRYVITLSARAGVQNLRQRLSSIFRNNYVPVPDFLGRQHDLDAFVLLVAEHAISGRRLVEAHAVRDDEARIDVALRKALEQRAQVAMHVGLSGADGERAVHERAGGKLVDPAAVDARH